MDSREEDLSPVGSPLFDIQSPVQPSALFSGSPERDCFGELGTSSLIDNPLPPLPKVINFHGRAADPFGMFGKRECLEIDSPESHRRKRLRSDSEDGNAPTAKLVYELRIRREDAFFNQHFATAEHISKELVMLTGEFEDLFRLAQVYFTMRQYRQAIQVLKTREYRSSAKCRILACRCYIALGMPEKALDMVDEENPFKFDKHCPEDIGDDIKVAATACALRGRIFAELGDFEKAKKNFVLALTFDRRCYDALDGLIKNNMLAPGEAEQHIVSDGSYTSDFLAASFKLKVGHNQAAEKDMTSKFGMLSHWGALLWRAKDYYTRGQILDSYRTLYRLLHLDPANRDCLPLYINVLAELSLTHELVELSKELKESYSGEAISLYADSVVELAEGRLMSAGSLLWALISKYPTFVPGWMAFGHFCTRKGYENKALKAYSTAARLLPTDYEPLLILGQYHRKLSNMQIAQDYLAKAKSLAPCPNPIILNELGMIAYQKKEYDGAARLFKEGLKSVAEHLPYSNLLSPRGSLKEALWVNLGHCLRYLCDYSSAETCFQNAFEVNSLSAPALAGLALVSHGLNDIYTAISYYHKSLRCDPTDPDVQSLLDFALEQTQDLNALSKVECSIASSDVDPLPNFLANPRRRRHNVVPYSLALDIRSEAEISNQNILSDTDTSFPNLRPGAEANP